MATKCADHGKIIVFRADFTNREQEESMKVETLLEFPWRKTKELFMNIGGLTGLQMLACGDDEGYIWVYKMPSWVTDTSNKPVSLPQKVAPLGL